VRRNENCKRNSKYSDLQGPALESENLRRLRAILVSSTYEVSGCIDERYGIDERQALRRSRDSNGRAYADISSFLVASRLAIYMTLDFTLI
jgi:hypothetical protein